MGGDLREARRLEELADDFHAIDVGLCRAYENESEGKSEHEKNKLYVKTMLERRENWFAHSRLVKEIKARHAKAYRPKHLKRAA
jgi:hypothetical protein